MSQQLDFFDFKKEVQLRLFAYENPLVLRFGKTYCGQIPTSAGIYKMRDFANEVIYVGKAKNLRQRLKSYFYVKPETSSRKTIQLISKVAKIEWHERTSERLALLSENNAIRTEQPIFNVVNKEFNLYPYQHLKHESRTLVFLLDFKKCENFDVIFGCFKSRSLAYRTQLAIMRLIYLIDQKIVCPFSISGRHFRNRFGKICQLELETLEPKKTFFMLRRFYEGKSAQLVSHLRAQLPDISSNRFMSDWVETDLNLLSDFYSHSARSLKRMKSVLKVSGKHVEQEQIDDLKVEFAFQPN